MYQQPKGGMMSDSDSCSSDEGGELEGKTRDELIEMAQGGGVYDSYVKPAGKFLGRV